MREHLVCLEGSGPRAKAKLARVLLDGVWIKDQSVPGGTPRPELKPFFDLQYAGLSKRCIAVAIPTRFEAGNTYGLHGDR